MPSPRTPPFAGLWESTSPTAPIRSTWPTIRGWPPTAWRPTRISWSDWRKREKPEIILIGATTFGREFAPRVAKRLGTGLTADCIGLDINEEGLLVQTAPSFGGNLVAEIVTPERRPQMATVRPGTFQEIPHDYVRTGER